MLKGTYTTRFGHTITVKFKSKTEAKVRLAELDRIEAYTEKVFSTDSGHVRYCYNKEAAVIRKMLEIG